LIRKFHEAKLNNENSITIWGSGTPRREFLHVDDVAAASYFIMEKYDEPGIINIGTGKDITISEMALLVKKIVGFEGNLVFDHSKPDGTPRKLLNVEKINALGWHASIKLEDGIADTYKDFLENYDTYISEIHKYGHGVT
jgi:GDP-L-fucose synthase